MPPKQLTGFRCLKIGHRFRKVLPTKQIALCGIKLKSDAKGGLANPSRQETDEGKGRGRSDDSTA